MREHVDALVHQVHRCAARRRLGVHGRVGTHKVGHIGDVHADLNVAVRQRLRVQRIVNVLAPGRVNAADLLLAQVFAVAPRGALVAARRHHPVVALARQAREHRLAKRPVRHVVLQQQTLLLGLLALGRAQRTHKVALGVSARGAPRIDRHQDLLAEQLADLARPDLDAGDLAVHGRRKHGLRAEARDRALVHRGRVDVCDIRAPVAARNAHDTARRLLLAVVVTRLDFRRLRLLIVVVVLTCIVIALRGIRLEHCIRRALPLGLGQERNVHHIAVHGTVHRLATLQQDGFRQCVGAHRAFKVVVCVRVEEAAMQRASPHAGLELRRVPILVKDMRAADELRVRLGRALARRQKLLQLRRIRKARNVLAHTARRQALLPGLVHILHVVAHEHDAEAAVRLAQVLDVPRRTLADCAVVAVVGRLVRIAHDAGAAVEVVVELPELAVRVADQRTQTVVQRQAAVAHLVQHRLEHHDVGERGVLEHIHLVEHDIGIDHDVVGLATVVVHGPLLVEHRMAHRHARAGALRLVHGRIARRTRDTAARNIVTVVRLAQDFEHLAARRLAIELGIGSHALLFGAWPFLNGDGRHSRMQPPSPGDTKNWRAHRSAFADALHLRSPRGRQDGPLPPLATLPPHTQAHVIMACFCVSRSAQCAVRRWPLQNVHAI